MKDVAVARTFALVAGEIAAQPDVAAARGQIVTRARDTLGSAGAALWQLRRDSTLRLDACTDGEFLSGLSDIVGRGPDGPTWQAMQDRTTTVSVDLRVETRWPDYVRRLLEESPVRSAVVYPLGVGGHDLGVLAVYSHQPGHFTPSVVELGAVFAAHAALALDNVTLNDKARHLEYALESNRSIGVAMGILMANRQITETQAFDLLRTTSQNTHQKLTMVADDVTFTGTIDILGAT